MRIGRKILTTIAQGTAVAIVWTSVARGQVGAGQPSVATFLSAVNSTTEELKALSVEKSVTAHDVHVVSLGKISNEGNSATITKAITKNAAQIEALRSAIRSNATIVGALTAAGVSVDQVVAMDVEPGSEITIFYR